MHIVFAYRGRLDPEKGIGEMINTIIYMIDHQDQTPHTFQFDIRGSGTMDLDIQRLAALYPLHVYYHGRVTHDQLMSDIGSVHYALMPSIFLETFGLTALESCSHGIPVIGYAKGGLKQFILSDLDCQHGGLQKVVQYCVNSLNMTDWQDRSQKVLNLSLGYTSDKRYSNFCDMTGLHF